MAKFVPQKDAAGKKPHQELPIGRNPGRRHPDLRRLHLQMSSGVTAIFSGNEAQEMFDLLIKDKVIKSDGSEGH